MSARLLVEHVGRSSYGSRPPIFTTGAESVDPGPGPGPGPTPEPGEAILPGETAVGTFRTEDRSPRLIRVPGVTNALAIRIESYVKSTGFTDADIARLRALLTE